MDIETVGSLPPDEILRQGIKYLQEKLASVVQSIQQTNGGIDPEGYDGGRSPDMNGQNGYGGGDRFDDGFTTPYGGDAGVNGGTTPFGGYGGGYSNGWA